MAVKMIKGPDRQVRKPLELLVGNPLHSPSARPADISEGLMAMKAATHSSGYTVHGGTAMAYGSHVSGNRNRIVERARKVNARFLLMTDGDSSLIPPGAAAELLYQMKKGKPVVSGTYFGKQRPYLPIAGMFNPETGGNEPLTELEPDEKERSLKKVDWVGGGFLLIDMQVFDMIDRAEQVAFGFYGSVAKLPYFHFTLWPNRQTGEMFEEGEDVTFCRKCGLLGIDIWLDTAVCLGHRTHADITREFFESEAEYIEKQLAAGKRPNEIWVNDMGL